MREGVNCNTLKNLCQINCVVSLFVFTCCFSLELQQLKLFHCTFQNRKNIHYHTLEEYGVPQNWILFQKKVGMRCDVVENKIISLQYFLNGHLYRCNKYLNLLKVMKLLQQFLYPTNLQPIFHAASYCIQTRGHDKQPKQCDLAR